jgi:hypothetical protein
MDDDEQVTEQVVGQAGAETKNADDMVYAAVLWIPDPTERRGWRDMWIERKPESKPKSIGFGRRP